MKQPQTILQVEDDENDVLFLERAIKKASVTFSVQIAADGQQAIGYLSGAGPFADRQAYPLPALILLDLRMPHIPGLDVLKWIRKQAQFKKTPVLILTSSE